jgi:hypothetical protein
LSTIAFASIAIAMVAVFGTDALGAPAKIESSPSFAPTGNHSAGPCPRIAQFRRHNFTQPTKINNRFFPLVAGQQLVYEGRANQGGTAVPHRITFTVTNMTKVINGVRTRVIWDQDFDEGQLAESELAFFAQDKKGNVWSMGEYPEEYENGKFAGAPSVWIPGVSGAKAGVMMPGRPRLGTPRYVQGTAPKIDFLDCAKVFQRNQRTCVPAKCYRHVLVTDENSPLDPESGHQRKDYAPGVGNVRISAVGDPEGETMVLTRIVQLGPSGLAQARAAVRKLERRAYRISSVYQNTCPAR